MRHLDLGGCVQHRPDGAHAVVVVVEGGELLGAQLVRLHDLAGQGRRLHTEADTYMFKFSILDVRNCIRGVNACAPLFLNDSLTGIVSPILMGNISCSVDSSHPPQLEEAHLYEPHRVEEHLGNEPELGRGHRHRPEQQLQVVRQRLQINCK